MKKYLILLLIILFPINVFANDELKEVSFIKATSYDTLWIKDNTEKRIIKIYGVTTNFSYEEKAIKYLEYLLENANKIEIKEVSSNKKYNATYNLVFVDSILLQKELIASGYYQLSVSTHSLNEFTNLCDIQQQAYINKKGIWNSNDTKELICHNIKAITNEKETNNKNTKHKKKISLNKLYELIVLESSILILLLIYKRYGLK